MVTNLECVRLDDRDLETCVTRLPKTLRALMTVAPGKLVVAGGYIASMVRGEQPRDVDVFCDCVDDAVATAGDLEPGAVMKNGLVTTIYLGGVPVQFIGAWKFEETGEMLRHFDFTICQAALIFSGRWEGFVSARFYPDLAARRLVYTCPPNAKPISSFHRALKFSRRGYTIEKKSTDLIASAMVDAASNGPSVSRLDPYVDMLGA